MTIARIEDVAALAQAFGADIGAIEPNVRKITTDADRAPLPSDDETQGYEVGSRWLWGAQEWVLTNATAGAANWVFTFTLALSNFGAIPGTFDSTSAIQRAIDSGKPVRVDGHYTVTAPLTGEFVQFYASSPDTAWITWRGLGAHGFVLRPTSYQQRTVLENIGIHTDKVVPADHAVDVSWLHLGTSGLEFFRNRFRMAGCNVAGAGYANTLCGWKRGVVLDFAFACQIERNLIYGKFRGGFKMPSEFTSDVGVYVPDQAARTLANVSISGNRIFGFHTAAKIMNVEGVDFINNDLQVNYDGVVIENPFNAVNQYRIRGNHIGVTGRQIAITNARQVLITSNELSYRGGRTDGGVVNLVELDGVNSGSITANTIRGNVLNDTDVVVHGILLTRTAASPDTLITRNIAIAANTFQDLSVAIRGLDAASVRGLGISPTNVFADIRAEKISFPGFPASSMQTLHMGTGNPMMAPASNDALRIVQNNAATLTLGREGGTGHIATFWYGGAYVGGISVSETATTYATSSDARLKEDLGPMADAGGIIDAIKLHLFAWKATGKQEDGVFAQELAEIYPEAVQHDEEMDLWAVDYSRLMPLVLRELQAIRSKLRD